MLTGVAVGPVAVTLSNTNRAFLNSRAENEFVDHDAHAHLALMRELEGHVCGIHGKALIQ